MRPHNMRAWGAAETLVSEIDRLVRRLEPPAANAAEHLVRACESVLFNIAEGAGARKPRGKIAAYEIARKEANEIRAILRRLVIGRALPEQEMNRPYNLACTIIAMLTAAIKRLEGD